MEKISSSHRKYLRGLAHKLNPSAYVGQKGVTDSLVEEIDQALDAAELIKVKFIDFKHKDQKIVLIDDICGRTRSHLAGMIGHVAILYRQHPDREKRQILLP